MASDVRDILQLPQDGPTTSNIRRAARPEREKRPDGINRELFALTGGAPPLTLSRPTYKARPSKKVTPWEWKPFTNPARIDGLVLHHWVKSNQEDGEYHFAKFNKPVQIIKYTDAEYQKYLEDPGWTREETDYLFSLLEKYDIRFVVVADTYAFPGSERSIEDMKERYYGVTRKLMIARETGQPSQYSYNKEREIERKKNLEILYGRTAEQIKEEEILYNELRRRDQKEEKLVKERESLVRLLKNIELPGQATPIGLSAADKAKKRKSMSRSTPEGTPTVETPVKRRRDKGPPESPGTPARSPEVEESPQKREKLPMGVSLRTSRLSTVKTTLLQKYQTMMAELGINSVQPNMPTAAVCAKYEELKDNVLALLEMKKHLDRAEQELRVAQAKGEGGGAAEGGGRRSSVGGVAGTPTPTRKRSIAVSPAISARELKRTRNNG
ncbi:swr complex subunit [Borealophlyctis nickersoniae]|nr:swr complex subunit [Borealophlyctis nickersoniae]